MIEIERHRLDPPTCRPRRDRRAPAAGGDGIALPPRPVREFLGLGREQIAIAIDQAPMLIAGDARQQRACIGAAAGREIDETQRPRRRQRGGEAPRQRRISCRQICALAQPQPVEREALAHAASCKTASRHCPTACGQSGSAAPARRAPSLSLVSSERSVIARPSASRKRIDIAGRHQNAGGFRHGIGNGAARGRDDRQAIRQRLGDRPCRSLRGTTAARRGRLPRKRAAVVAAGARRAGAHWSRGDARDRSRSSRDAVGIARQAADAIEPPALRDRCRASASISRRWPLRGVMVATARRRNWRRNLSRCVRRRL